MDRIENQELIEFLMDDIKNEAVRYSKLENHYGNLNAKYHIVVQAIRDHKGITSEERKEISDALDKRDYWKPKIK